MQTVGFQQHVSSHLEWVDSCQELGHVCTISGSVRTRDGDCNDAPTNERGMTCAHKTVILHMSLQRDISLLTAKQRAEI
eukprot:m.148459 g.148459  ORF g.148459 m.148459 type:complete len:79 (+) comp30598_c0_seq1:5515-5751(+)